MLDLGCGPATTLLDIKNHVQIPGKKLQTTGLVLKRNPAETYHGADQLIAGEFGNALFKKRFDFIYSVDGVTVHTREKAKAVEKVISLLRPGGVAILGISTPIAAGNPAWEEIHAHLRSTRTVHFGALNGHVLLISKHPNPMLVQKIIQENSI